MRWNKGEDWVQHLANRSCTYVNLNTPVPIILLRVTIELEHGFCSPGVANVPQVRYFPSVADRVEKLHNEDSEHPQCCLEHLSQHEYTLYVYLSRD